MARLLVHAHTPQAREVWLADRANVIGRLPHCEVRLENEQSLSRTHARIYPDADGWRVQDLGSKNGTMVNGVAVTDAPLRGGDALRFGEVDAIFLDSDSLSVVPSFEITPETPPPLEGLLAPGRSALNLRTLGEEERAVDKLRVLLRAAEELARLDRLDAVLDRALDLLLRVFDVDRAAVFLEVPSSRGIEVAAVRARSTQPGDAGPSRSAATWVWERGTAALFADALDDQRLERSHSVHVGSIRSCMAATLVGARGRLGVLYVDNRELVDHFVEEDLRFLGGIAGQVALAVENARLYEQVQAEAAARQRLLRFFPEAVARRILTAEVGALQPVEVEITALFCDISDYSALCSRLPAREVLAVLNAYFRAMTEIVFREGGTLEKYIGDALMAVWGAPFARPDDARRAVRAAIAMQRAMTGLNEDLAARGVRVEVHIGLHTGPAVAGGLGSEDYLQYAAIGDATTLASRVSDAAGANEILLSEATLSRLGPETLEIQRVPPLALGGRPEPLPVWRLNWQRTNLSDE